MLAFSFLLLAAVLVAPAEGLAVGTLKWYPSRRSLVYEREPPNGAHLVVTDAKGGKIFGGTLTAPQQVVSIVADGTALALVELEADVAPFPSGPEARGGFMLLLSESRPSCRKAL